MLKKYTPPSLRLAATLLLCSLCLLLQSAQAAVISDDFTKDFDRNDWTALSYACLTARTASTTGTSSIPGCNLASPDASGSGALRLTPAAGNQRGSIVSNYTFPTNQGLQVTFSTYTFGGDRGGTGGLGADGISFFLMDGSVGTTLGSGASAVNNIGAVGGSLSYSCSNGNSPYNGLTGAYLGLGMDEYGNFLNTGDNTSTGIAQQSASTSTNGYNSWGSGTYQSNRIGLRGAGNVSWYWLNQNYPLMFPSSFSTSLQNTIVQQTCRTGFLWDYRSAVSQSISAATVSGTTLSLTLPSTAGYSNGDSVTLGGTIRTTSPTQSISVASVSGTTLTLTTSGGSFTPNQTVTLGGTITATPAAQAISSFSNFNSNGSGKTVRINVNTGSGASTASFTTGASVYVSGITGTTAYPNNTSYTVASVNTNYITVNCTSCTSTYPSVGSGTVILGTSSAGTPVSLSGTTYTTISGTTGTTVKVTLPSAAGAVNNTSGTVALPAPSATGQFTVANLSSTGFDVTLSSAAASVTNTSGTAVGNARQTATTIQNYAVIPGGYWVLPSTQPLANEAVSVRSQATPVTYKLLITPAGNLNFLYSYNGGAFQQVLSNWPITSSNGPLPSSFRFGFAAATGGSTNNHDIACFLAEPVTSASGAGGNAVQSGQFKTATQLYIASYDSYFWTGSVTALPIVSSNSGVVGAGTATWDGNCALTGGACSSTGAAGTTRLAPADRQLLTWDGTQGIPLQWTSLATDQKDILNSTDTLGENRLNWLRGDRSNEQTASPPGVLRARAGVLGDVVDSSPTWVGPPSINYGSAIADTLYSSAGSESSHATFNSTLARRLNVVYAGSNDGMLHGFRSGRNNTNGSYDGALNDGREVLGFMPYSTLASSNVVDLTRPTYGHWYFADASPGFGDVYYGGAWHTWLVSGMGPGGKEIFALDVTDPEGTATGTTAFAESSASSLVMGDWTPSVLTTLTCVNAATNCGDNLGNTFGTPIVRRLHNGQWAIIFGNGYGSTNQHAGVFVGLIKSTAPNAGSVSFYWLDTGAGTSANPDGIAYVSSADLDGDHVTDYLYAGDLLGKVWRFDLTSSNPADWAVSKFGQPGATPIYDAGSTHPITTQIATTVVALPQLGQRVMLGFGTGQGVPFTTNSGETYASGTQSLYGVWDWDMAAWNNGRTSAAGVSIPASSVKYASLAQVTTSPYLTVAKSDLQAVSVVTTAATANSVATRSAAIATVCWQGSTACASGNTKYGWVFDFPSSGEQLLFSPKFEGGALVVNTTIPPGSNVAGQCTPATTTGWSMAFNMASGGGFTQHVFADAAGNFVLANGRTSIIGIQQNSVGQPYFFTVGSKRYLASPDVSGGADIHQFNTGSGVTVKRVSWEQIR